MTETIGQRSQRKATKTSFGITRGDDARTPAVYQTSVSDLMRRKEENVIYISVGSVIVCVRDETNQAGC